MSSFANQVSGPISLGNPRARFGHDISAKRRWDIADSLSIHAGTPHAQVLIGAAYAAKVESGLYR